MVSKALLRTMFTAGIDEDDLHLYMRVLFINGILYVLGLVLAFFTVVHYQNGAKIEIIYIELAAFALILFLFLLLHLNKSIKVVGHISALGVIGFFLYYIPVTQNENLSFVWVFYVPFFIVLMNGWKVGLFYLTLFFIMIFPLAYTNIGVWEYGSWTEMNYYRFVAGLLLGTAMAIALDVAIYFTNLKEQVIRKTDKEHLHELETISNTDGLTGIYNRRYFNKVFDDKARSLNGGEKFLLFFMLDIDFFKAYNDQYGHQEGDVVIQKVAETIRHFLRRESDLVFRLGGEEFGGLVETRNPHKTAEWLSHLGDAVKALDISHATNVDLPSITVSGGISCTNVYNKKTVHELYKKADDALYQAKKQGRDQFVVEAETLL